MRNPFNQESQEEWIEWKPNLPLLKQSEKVELWKKLKTVVNKKKNTEEDKEDEEDEEEEKSSEKTELSKETKEEDKDKSSDSGADGETPKQGKGKAAGKATTKKKAKVGKPKKDQDEDESSSSDEDAPKEKEPVVGKRTAFYLEPSNTPKKKDNQEEEEEEEEEEEDEEESESEEEEEKRPHLGKFEKFIAEKHDDLMDASNGALKLIRLGKREFQNDGLFHYLPILESVRNMGLTIALFASLQQYLLKQGQSVGFEKGAPCDICDVLHGLQEIIFEKGKGKGGKGGAYFSLEGARKKGDVALFDGLIEMINKNMKGLVHGIRKAEEVEAFWKIQDAQVKEGPPFIDQKGFHIIWDDFKMESVEENGGQTKSDEEESVAKVPEEDQPKLEAQSVAKVPGARVPVEESVEPDFDPQFSNELSDGGDVWDYGRQQTNPPNERSQKRKRTDRPKEQIRRSPREKKPKNYE
jgi:hypothetical protein